MPRTAAANAVNFLPAGAGATVHRVSELDAVLDLETRRVYVLALQALHRAGVEFLIGGAHALAPYTGIVRDTKDLDVFLRRQDCERGLAVLADAGFTTELTFPHWLGKAYAGDRFIDLIYSAGNGVAAVDNL